MSIDFILYNAKIFTLDPAQPWAEAVACRQGRIVQVGSNEEIVPQRTRKMIVYDAEGQLVLPGLIDAHVHFLQYAIRQHQVELFGVTDLAEVRRRVEQAVAETPPGGWVQGAGWDEHLWDQAPTAAFLDEIAPNTPVFLARMDMHSWWLNSEAMRRANITAETPDPPESRIERNEAGQPTGILREWNAMRLVSKHIPRPDDDTLQRWLGEAIKDAHRLGLTGIHDQRVERDGRKNLRFWQHLRQQDQLDLRVHFNLAANFLPEIKTLGLKPGFGDDRLWLGHIKAFADGTLGSRTAYLLEPYEGEPDNRGLLVNSVETLADWAAQAHQAGFSYSVHAIGDGAVREVANIMTEFPPDLSENSGWLPHRIEHVQGIHSDDIARMAEHKLVASMQPIHLASDWSPADKLWGAARNETTYCFRTLLDRGVRLAFGSDAPVAPLSPLVGIQAAVTRQDMQGQPEGGWYPAQRLTLTEALEAYTLGPAYLAGKQSVQGSITPSKWADMIVLSRDLFEIPANEIGQTEITATIFDGGVVYEA